MKGNHALLDVGANIGIMSVHMAQAFPNQTIHSFEPMPDNLHVLNRIISHYQLKNIIVHELAVGNEEGEIQMVLPHNGKVKMQGLTHVVHDSITEWNDGELFNAPIKKIDDIIGSTIIEGIKIDVENFEYFALLGASQILKRDQPIIYAELWDNENRDQCFKLLGSLGYKAYVVINNDMIVFDSTIHTKQNFIFAV